MRIALAPGGESMLRVGRVLLADARVSAVGVPDSALGTHPRVTAIEDPASFDAVIAHDLGSAVTTVAWKSGVPIVLATELESPSESVADGANLEGLARCLAQQALATVDGFSASVGWTTPGRKLMTGPSLAFPAPLGILKVVDDRDVAVAPIDGDLAGAVVSASGRLGTATFGLVESRDFLEAIILAATAICVASGHGTSLENMSEHVIAEVRRAGLVIASKVA